MERSRSRATCKTPNCFWSCEGPTADVERERLHHLLLNHSPPDPAHVVEVKRLG